MQNRRHVQEFVVTNDPIQTAPRSLQSDASDARNLSRLRQRSDEMGVASNPTAGNSVGTGSDRIMEFRVTADTAGGVKSSAARRLKLSGARYTVGSAAGCSIQIPDPRLRPIHAMLTHAGFSAGHDSSGVTVRCFEESILVNGRSVRDARLSVGDVMKIGNHQFELLVANIASGRTATAPSGSAGIAEHPSADASPSNRDALERDLQRRREALDARDAELSAKKRQYEHQIEIATGRLAESQRQADSATEAVTRIRTQFESLSEQVDQLSRQQADREQAYGLAQEQQQKLQAELSRERDEALDMRSRDLAARKMAEEKIGEMEVLHGQTSEQLRESLERSETAERDAEIAIDDLRRAQSQVDELQQRASDLQQRYDTSVAAAERANAELQDATEKLRLADLEVEQAGERTTALEIELDRLREDAEQAREEMDGIRTESNHDREENQRATEDALLDAQRAQAEAQQAQAEMLKARSEAELAVAETERAEEEIRQLTADNLQSRQEAERVGQEAEQARLEAESANQTSCEERSRREAAESNLQTAQATVESIRGELEQIRAELKISRQESQYNADEATDANDRLAEANSQVARVEADLRHSHDRIEQLQQQAQRLTDTVQHAREESESLRQLYERSQQKVNQLQQAIASEGESAENDNRNLIEETDHLRTAMDQLSAELAIANVELNQLRSENETLQEQINGFQSQSEAVPSDLDNDWQADLESDVAHDELQIATETFEDGCEAAELAEQNASGDVPADFHTVEWDAKQSDAAITDASITDAAITDAGEQEGAEDDTDNPWPTYELGSNTEDSEPAVGDAISGEWDDGQWEPTVPTQSESALELSEDSQWGTGSTNEAPPEQADDSISDDDDPIAEDDDSLAEDSIQQNGSLASLLIRTLDEDASEAADSAVETDPQNSWVESVSGTTFQTEVDSESNAIDATARQSFDDGVDGSVAGDDWQSADRAAERTENEWQTSWDHSVAKSDLRADLGISGDQGFDAEMAEEDGEEFESTMQVDPVELSLHLNLGSVSAVPAEEIDNAADESASDVEDDSIEAYMNRLLGRVHGHSSAPAASRESVSMSSVSKSLPAATSERADAKPESIESDEAVADLQHEQGPILPRSQAPEKNSNLSAMRQLANDSARDAISVSTSKQVRQIRSQALFDFGIAITCLLIGLAAPLIASGLLLYMIWAMVVIASVLCLKTGISLWLEAKSRSVR